MQDSLRSLISKWKSMDSKSKLIYAIIAVIIVAALIFGVGSLSGGNARNCQSGEEPSSYEEDIGIDIDDEDISGTDSSDPADYADIIDDGTDEDDDPVTTESTTEKTEKTKKTKKTKTTTEPTTTTTEKTTEKTTKKTSSASVKVDKNGEYQTRDEVAAYLAAYGKLPSNYITKYKAEDLGWVASKGNLRKVAPGKSIGGDKFSNREGILPKKSGRQYYECDIDYNGGTRNAKRIVFSSDGLIFYTEDHYETYIKYDKETGKWTKNWK